MPTACRRQARNRACLCLTEARGGKPHTLIYLFDREPPAAAWNDAENRSGDISAWMLQTRAPVVLGTDDKNAPDAIGLRCRWHVPSRGVSVINDIPSARAEIETGGGRLKGKPSRVRACGDEWQRARHLRDRPRRAAPASRDRVAANGMAGGAEGCGQGRAGEVLTAAGKAKATSDAAPVQQPARRRGEAADGTHGERGEAMFKATAGAVFTPASSRSPTSCSMMRPWPASRRAPGSGADSWDMECNALLRKEEAAGRSAPRIAERSARTRVRWPATPHRLPPAWVRLRGCGQDAPGSPGMPQQQPAATAVARILALMKNSS